MSDLSHWDFAENFSGYDAAALMLGVQPWESETDRSRISVVTARMALHYQFVQERLTWRMYDMHFKEPEESVAKRPIEFVSVELDKLHQQWWIDDKDGALTTWLADKRRSAFEVQQFSRSVIVRWLADIGMKSVYQFSRDQIDPIASGRWPWGNHHTELLGHLEAAAREFWGEYDSTNPKKTAPKNETVIQWLTTTRKVSATVATSMATMLRPDGLPTGPRK